MDWVTDESDGSDVDLSWLQNDDNPPLPQAPSNQALQDGTRASTSSLMPRFLDMGFSEKMVADAIEKNGDGNYESILEDLLTYKMLEETPSGNEGNEENTPSDENDWGDDDSSDIDDFDDMDFELEMSGQASFRKKLRTLEEMGFSRDVASSAIERCGEDVPIFELADSIYAAQTAEKEGGVWEYDGFNSYKKKEGDKYDPFTHNNKRQKCNGASSSRHRSSTQMRERLKRAYHRPATTTRRCGGDGDAVGELDSLNLPNPMVGFGLPTDPGRQLYRDIPKEAQGPPYFFYENVALTPKGVWPTISRFLYGISPEFVDSKYFSAACRKRGYIHNLPIANRFCLEPIPQKTILDAFPSARAHWPTWDTRTQFNCLQTCIGSAQLTERIRAKLVASDDPPPPDVIRWVMYECRKWNLIWVGQNRVAPLEPDEVEYLLGFPRDHTRGWSRTERYKSLGNSFQVDTVAYQLSVLRDLYPNGIRVLSLFSGIGGAEVALHRLGIKMTAVLSVEISPINRTILRSWWDQTGQVGELEEVDDVQCVTDAVLERFIARHGGFDLVIGGSPCNNLAGSNRHHRDGLSGEHSSLFYHYFRILDIVRNLMARY
ncbi:DNA (Cytosine-5)-methyltransferase DRM2 [Rhynchospora pubera]|uniref:DNA (cytosine-5-)-methyltransferase n=1 Tax=Rhynchospora pubera TaxID=906938 RepID=A0AAV8BX59_9POAL|nr:DNA (Cytosine-5)-methyltransferase DRM2 [Rhynchospora pubera]